MWALPFFPWSHSPISNIPLPCFYLYPASKLGAHTSLLKSSMPLLHNAFVLLVRIILRSTQRWSTSAQFPLPSTILPIFALSVHLSSWPHVRTQVFFPSWPNLPASFLPKAINTNPKILNLVRVLPYCRSHTPGAFLVKERAWERGGGSGDPGHLLESGFRAEPNPLTTSHLEQTL